MDKLAHAVTSAVERVLVEYCGDSAIDRRELDLYLYCCYFLDAQPHASFADERSRMGAYRSVFERRNPDKSIRIGLQLRLELD